MAVVYLGLGSNLGDAERSLREAFRELGGILAGARGFLHRTRRLEDVAEQAAIGLGGSRQGDGTEREGENTDQRQAHHRSSRARAFPRDAGTGSREGNA